MARLRALSKSPIVAALDLGSTKVCCLIAKVEGPRLRTLGVGFQKNLGLKNGSLIDTASIENAILNAVHEAEQAAGLTIEKVFVNLSGSSIKSSMLNSELKINGGEVTQRHLEKLIAQAEQAAQVNDQAPNRQLIHLFPIEYAADFERGLKDPRGLHAEMLSARVLTVSSNSLNAKTLLACIERCHLSVQGFAVSAYAAGLSSLTAEERETGTTLVDIGGGTTSIALFKNGLPLQIETIPVGGNHISNDISHALSISREEAERLKILHGAALPIDPSEDRRISIQAIGDLGRSEEQQISRSMLVGFVQPRLEEIFEIIQERFEASQAHYRSGRRLVLVGGSSRIPRIRELASLLLEKQVRLGIPSNLAGVSEMHRGPEFSVAAGLLNFAKDKHKNLSAEPLANDLIESDSLSIDPLIHKQRSGSRFGSWIRTYF